MRRFWQCAFVAIVCLGGCVLPSDDDDRPGPGPEPTPISDPSEVAHQMLVARGQSLAARDRDLARRVRAGEIKSAADYLDLMNQGTAQIEIELNQRYLGKLWEPLNGDKWDSGKAAALLDAQAVGWSRVK